MRKKSNISIELILWGLIGFSALLTMTCFALYVLDTEERILFEEIRGFTIVSSLMLLFSLALLKYNIFIPLRRVSQISGAIAHGDLSKSVKIQGINADLNLLSRNVNTYIENARRASEFIKDIGDGVENNSFKKLGDSDHLGVALFDMNDKLKIVAQEEKKRQYNNDGASKFNNVIQNNLHNRKELCEALLNEIVGFTGCQLGLIYSLKSDDQSLIFEASNGVSPQMNEQGEMIGSLTLVHQCIKDKAPIVTQNIPESYHVVSSGLGTILPISILVVPLIFNQKVQGVIELARLKNLEAHEIELVEAVAVSLAAVVSSQEMAERTAELLETSKKVNQEMKLKEEEALEQLQRISEESQLNEALISAIDQTVASIHFNMNGGILYANELFLNISGFDEKGILVMSDDDITPKDDQSKMIKEMMWNNIKQGTFFSGEFRKINTSGTEIWLNGTYNPIKNIEGEVYKVIMFANIITEEKAYLNVQQGRLDAMQKNVATLEIGLDRGITTFNAKFLNDFGYKRKDLRKSLLDDILTAEYIANPAFEKLMNQVIEGDRSVEQIQFKKMDGVLINSTVTFDPIENLMHKVDKIFITIEPET